MGGLGLAGPGWFRCPRALMSRVWRQSTYHPFRILRLLSPLVALPSAPSPAWAFPLERCFFLALAQRGTFRDASIGLGVLILRSGAEGATFFFVFGVDYVHFFITLAS